MNIEELGFTKEEIEAKVVDSLVSVMLSSAQFDYDEGEEYKVATKFRKLLDAKIKDHIDYKISSLADEHVLPNVSKYIEELSLQSTNEWGEAKGERISFVEYLVGRANNYITEKVDHSGKTKQESGGFSWSGKQTRLSYMIDKHLQHSIEIAMKSALADANNQLTIGITETVKSTLKAILGKIKVSANL